MTVGFAHLSHPNFNDADRDALESLSPVVRNA